MLLLHISKWTFTMQKLQSHLDLLRILGMFDNLYFFFWLHHWFLGIQLFFRASLWLSILFEFLPLSGQLIQRHGPYSIGVVLVVNGRMRIPVLLLLPRILLAHLTFDIVEIEFQQLFISFFFLLISFIDVIFNDSLNVKGLLVLDLYYFWLFHLFLSMCHFIL